MTGLEKLRTEKGLSRERLAALAGLTARTIYGIEREEVEPQRATATVLAMVLKCDASEIRPRP